MLEFSIKGFSNDNIKYKLMIGSTNTTYLSDLFCDFWAEKCQIISPTSIEYHLSQQPLIPLLALEHYLCQQKRNILSLNQKEDPTIQLLHRISKEKFENECHVEEEKLEVIKDLCYKAKSQFQKIITCIENNEPIEKINQYAKVGEDFFMRQERKFDNSIRDVTPIEDTPNISNTLDTENDSNENADFSFIETYKLNNTRMNWKNCFKQGCDNGLFSNYISAYTLKAAYHNQKAKARKRKAANT